MKFAKVCAWYAAAILAASSMLMTGIVGLYDSYENLNKTHGATVDKEFSCTTGQNERAE